MDQYFRYTRSPWYSFLFVLPLLAVYQAVVLLANFGSASGVINGADAIIRNGLSLVGVHGWLGTSLVLALVAVLAYRRPPLVDETNNMGQRGKIAQS